MIFKPFLVLGAWFLVTALRVSAATTWPSDGSRADVQAIIDAGTTVDGDTITIPGTAGSPQSFTWTSAVSLSGKGIKLSGGGAGRVVARSASSVVVTGASGNQRTFTLITEGLSGMVALRSALTVGATLKIYRTGGEQNGTLYGTGQNVWLRGTVASLTGDTLVMDITSVSATTGTHPLWIITTEAATTIVHNGGASTNSLTITEDATHSVEISGIRFTHDPTNANDVIHQIYLNGNDGKPILIHDCYFERLGSGDSIRAAARRGIIWNCSFVSLPMSFSYAAFQNTYEGFTTSWSTASTMGTADTTGINNLYIEDSDFHAYISATDFDANSRVVFRRNLVNHASVASHGNDTGPYGVRHGEIYDCEFAFQPYNDGQTLPLDRFINMRGGSWAVTDNIIPDLNSTDYGNKTEIQVEVQNLGRAGGNNACWGYNIVGLQYPAPRQFGFGYVTGAAGNDVNGIYKGDLEPAYIWNNTGGFSLGLFNYGWGNAALCSNSGEADFNSKVDLIADYVQVNREYYLSAKPDWTRYTYPHPLRTGGGGTTATVSGTTTVSGTLTLP